MVIVQVFCNGETKEYTFNNLLDGLHWLKVTNVVFDYIVIDYETTVTFEEFDGYFDKLNDFCRKVYGYHY